MKILDKNELNELNEYLNEISLFFYDNYPEILNNLKKINDIACSFYKEIKKYEMFDSSKTNNLTFEDVYLLSREIIESIDSKYLNDFDNLIKSGELEFKYNGDRDINDYCSGLNCSGFSYSNFTDYKSINIDRQFNYVDVKVLVHEYTHYINAVIGNFNTKNNNLLTEFLAIYFEFYAVLYLTNKGIDAEELNYIDRLYATKNYANTLILSSIVLLAYQNFGDIDEKTYEYIEKLDLSVSLSKEKFNDCLIKLYDDLKSIDLNLNRYDKENYMIRAQKLSNKIFQDISYTLGTTLAFYAMGYSEMEDIIWLNDNVENYDCDAFSLLKKINIDIGDSDFNKKVTKSLEKYIKKYCVNRGIYDNNNSRSNSSR